MYIGMSTYECYYGAQSMNLIINYECIIIRIPLTHRVCVYSGPVEFVYMTWQVLLYKCKYLSITNAYFNGHQDWVITVSHAISDDFLLSP